MWKRTVAINSTLPNRADIVFQEVPDFTVTETIQVDSDQDLKQRSLGIFVMNDIETYSGEVESIDMFLLSSGSVATDNDERK
jgi:hypothetical protein